MNRITAAIAVAGGLTLALGGCASTATQPGSTTATVQTPAATSPAVTSAATTSPAAPATTPAPASASTSTGPQTTTASTSPTPSPTASRAPSCSEAFSVARTGNEGAAGSRYVTFTAANRGASTCTLHGYAGVSIVGRSDSSQIGAAAVKDTAVPPKDVPVAPGATTSFVVRVVQAANYPAAQCNRLKGDGFRIYLPGSTKARFVADEALWGCQAKTTDLLTVSPVGYTP